MQLWLLEALLGASAADEIEAQQLLRLPESFPFTVSVGVTDLRRYKGFDIHRQGLDMDMVAVRKVKLEPPPKHAKKPKKQATRPTQPSLFDNQTDEIVSKNGQVHAVQVLPVPSTLADDEQDTVDEQRRIEDSIKNEVLRTLSDRASRFLQVRGNFLIPDSPFRRSIGRMRQTKFPRRPLLWLHCLDAGGRGIHDSLSRADQAQEETEPGRQLRQEQRIAAQEKVRQR